MCLLLWATVPEIKIILYYLIGSKMTSDEIDEMIKAASEAEDGMIDYEGSD